MIDVLVVFVEGKIDQAFWDGAAQRHAWSPDRGRAPKRKAGSVFRFAKGTRAFVVVEVDGKSKLRDEMRADIAVYQELERTESRRYGFAACSDSDRPDSEPLVANREWPELPSGSITVQWQVDDPADATLPSTQTLERLTAAALRDAFPTRATAVGAWLQTRPDRPTKTSPKAWTWSHIAGWYEVDGFYDFYRAIWREAAVAPHLERRLVAAGGQPILDFLRS